MVKNKNKGALWRWTRGRCEGQIYRVVSDGPDKDGGCSVKYIGGTPWHLEPTPPYVFKADPSSAWEDYEDPFLTWAREVVENGNKRML